MSSAYLRKVPAYILLMVFLLTCVSAQETNAIPATLIIPDGTPVKLRLAESVSSAHARVGDLLDFIVVRDVNVGGFTVIPAGTKARGSITEVKGRRILGIGGKVCLKLDSLELVNGDRVELRGSKEVKGGSRTKLMAAAMIATALIFLPATPVFLLTRGHTSTVVKSTEITAKIDGANPGTVGRVAAFAGKLFRAGRDDGLSATACLQRRGTRGRHGESGVCRPTRRLAGSF